MSAEQARSCFVIMPFGEKKNDDEKIDFDMVYNYIIRPPVETLGIKCIRCAEIETPGQIHKKMFQSIHAGDVAVVDITTLNANVFYELGVRHSLCAAVTVLIRKKGTLLPFNIQGSNIIEYDTELSSANKAIEKIKTFIQNGLAAGRTDSPVLEALPHVRVMDSPKPLECRQIYRASLKPPNQKKQIALVTGDIRNVKNVADVWVNSENTNMQMARFYDGSISSIIRYLGAKKDALKHVVEDTIASELTALMGHHDSVPPATVIVTGSDELAKSHGVKKIFHAATHQGQVVHGYQPVKDLPECVSESLGKMEELSGEGLKSILFPLMGTRWGKINLHSTAAGLLRAAWSHLQNNPGSQVETVYFLMYCDKELEACRQILEESNVIAETNLVPEWL